MGVEQNYQAILLYILTRAVVRENKQQWLTPSCIDVIWIVYSWVLRAKVILGDSARWRRMVPHEVEGVLHRGLSR